MTADSAIPKKINVGPTVLAAAAVRSIDLETIDPVIHPKPLEGDAKLAAILTKSVVERTRFERYERRVLSRRKSAIRNIDAYRAARHSMIIHIR